MASNCPACWIWPPAGAKHLDDCEENPKNKDKN